MIVEDDQCGEECAGVEEKAFLISNSHIEFLPVYITINSVMFIELKIGNGKEEQLFTISHRN